MIESEENKEYLPIQGLEAFNKATAQLLLGEGHPAIKEVRDNMAASAGTNLLACAGCEAKRDPPRHAAAAGAWAIPPGHALLIHWQPCGSMLPCNKMEGRCLALHHPHRILGPAASLLLTCRFSDICTVPGP